MMQKDNNPNLHHFTHQWENMQHWNHKFVYCIHTSETTINTTYSWLKHPSTTT
jgi:hypothetical protein